MGRTMRKRSVIIAVLICTAVTLFAEDETTASEKILTFGGEVWTTGGIAWEWDNWSLPGNPTAAYQYIAVDSSLSLEARPSDEVFAFGRAVFSVDGRTDDSLPEGMDFSDLLTNSFRIDSLYTRVTALPMLAITGGKRYLPGEIGRFFSPADYLNKEPINYLDPEVEREGPFAVSAEMNIGEQHILLHLLLDDMLRPWEIAVAPQAALTFGPVETWIGGKFQWNGPLHASAGVQAEVFIFRPFAEIGIEYFSDKKYISPTEDDVWPAGVQVESAADRVIIEASAGSSITVDTIGLEAYIQYLFNSWGGFYSDNYSILSGRSTEILLEEGRIDESDLYLPALHYLALEAAWDIFDTGINLGGTWLINLQALSYSLDLNLSYSPIPFIELALSVPIVLHDFAGEFGTVRNGWKGDFSVTLGTEF